MLEPRQGAHLQVEESRLDHRHAGEALHAEHEPAAELLQIRPRVVDRQEDSSENHPYHEPEEPPDETFLHLSAPHEAGLARGARPTAVDALFSLVEDAVEARRA